MTGLTREGFGAWLREDPDRIVGYHLEEGEQPCWYCPIARHLGAVVRTDSYQINGAHRKQLDPWAVRFVTEFDQAQAGMPDHRLSAADASAILGGIL